MVPKKVGDELRRRRLELRLKQSDVARQIGTTRAYVSAVERGVDWDPDAEKMVAWARALSLDEDYILRRLNRSSIPVDERMILQPEVVAAITQVVAAGIRAGFADLMTMLAEGDATPRSVVDQPQRQRRGRPA